MCLDVLALSQGCQEAADEGVTGAVGVHKLLLCGLGFRV